MLKLKLISIRLVTLWVGLILFAGCGDSGSDEGNTSSSAALWAETVNCNATQNRLITEGSKNLTFEAQILTPDGDAAWCWFSGNQSYLSGEVGSVVFITTSKNTLQQNRTVNIQVTFSNHYTTTLSLTQTAYSSTADYDQPWGEQPQKLDGEGYVYKTYFTTLANSQNVRNYSICYDKTKRVSRWVAYPLYVHYVAAKSYTVSTSTAGRTDAWAYDDWATEYASGTTSYGGFTLNGYRVTGTKVTEPAIAESNQQNIIKAYGQGGYQRGHMLASSMRYSTWNTNAQTFFATNMMPQNGTLNGGNTSGWPTLESKERSWQSATAKYDTVFVVTGAHFANAATISNSNGSIGVPSHCWKIYLRKRANTSKPISACTAEELKSIGFVFTNDAAGAALSLSEASCTVSQVEALTGFSFFRNLDPAVADAVKNQKSLSDWQ